MRQRVFESRNAVLRQFAATLAVSCLLVLIAVGGASAQSGTPTPDQGKAAAQPAEAAKDAAQNQNQKRTDEFAEAARTINGPAGNPECVWLGRRAVQLMYRDDLDTAFRHIDLYDRFGCPGGHIQAAFRCLTRFLPQIDDKAPNTLNNLTQACWINPAAQPQQTTAAASPSPTPAPGASQPQPAASPSPAASPTPGPSK
ncbi:hypothetical protein [Bradyrhizobium sp. DOA9]|uniref:hypothetical protein n=1 Tax=Bradyrhizobium sp. DOA9 TaxID=1126627 RepID=UPI00046AD44F|nr:hypothetical protein [Bradyrhizobium sp. DOA9]GAJ35417.1 hypothetical protein BDOA9_0146220 [Bradyrhizobium sp. DOA9]